MHSGYSLYAGQENGVVVNTMVGMFPEVALVGVSFLALLAALR